MCKKFNILFVYCLILGGINVDVQVCILKLLKIFQTQKVVFFIPFLQIDGYFSYKLNVFLHLGQLKNNVFAFKIVKNGIFGSEFCAYKIKVFQVRNL